MWLLLACAPSPTAAPPVSPSVPAPPPPPAAVWPPAGWHVAGPVTAPERGVPGWVELPSLAKHRAMEAVAPQSPRIEGTFDDEGMFYTDGPTDAPVACAGAVRWLDTNGVRIYDTLPEPRADYRFVALCDGRTPVVGMSGVIVADDACTGLLARARAIEEAPAACRSDADCVLTSRVSISGISIATSPEDAAELARISEAYRAATCPPTACAQGAPETPRATCSQGTCTVVR